MQVAYSSAKQLGPTGRMFESIQIASDQVGKKQQLWPFQPVSVI
jgi:hypothetical protein